MSQFLQLKFDVNILDMLDSQILQDWAETFSTSNRLYVDYSWTMIEKS